MLIVPFAEQTWDEEWPVEQHAAGERPAPEPSAQSAQLVRPHGKTPETHEAQTIAKRSAIF